MKNDGRMKRRGIHFFAGALIMFASAGSSSGAKKDACGRGVLLGAGIYSELATRERRENNDSAWRWSA